MTRVSVKHRIDYAYDHKVLLSRHRFRLAPQRDTQAIIEGYSFVLRPANRLYWQYDVYGNKMARADFDVYVGGGYSGNRADQFEPLRCIGGR